jgi:hypothetical protein
VRSRRVPYDFSDDLMPWNDAFVLRSEFAFDNVKVRPAHAAGTHAQENLPGCRFGIRNTLYMQRPRANSSGQVQNSGLHDRPLTLGTLEESAST